jgi:hypothetical protein
MKSQIRFVGVTEYSVAFVIKRPSRHIQLCHVLLNTITWLCHQTSADEHIGSSNSAVPNRLRLTGSKTAEFFDDLPHTVQ